MIAVSAHGRLGPVFELPGGLRGGLTPQLLSQPPNTLSNYALGGQLCSMYRPMLHRIYITILVGL